MIIIHMTYMDVADKNPVADKTFQPNLLSRQQNAPIQSKFPFPASPLTIYTPPPNPNLASPNHTKIPLPSASFLEAAPAAAVGSLGRRFLDADITGPPPPAGMRAWAGGSCWVCEVREPQTQARIWLGTFPTTEMVARAPSRFAVPALPRHRTSSCSSGR